jgi:hypothetical protein
LTATSTPSQNSHAQSKSPDANVLALVLRHVIQEIDRNLPVFDARSMKDVYNNRAVKAPALISEVVATLDSWVSFWRWLAYMVSCPTR